VRLPQDDDDLLKPREVAEIFGVRTTTIARWARDGRLTPVRTPGGHRRYRLAAIRALIEAERAEPGETVRHRVEDAVRLYHQGWSIRQVAEKSDMSYGAMRRVLIRHTTLRNRGGRETWTGPGTTSG
jgi:excisionase family DNA binding protein